MIPVHPGALRIGAAILFSATLLLSHTAQAQFTQQGPKLIGSGAIGNELQGSAVALSADGNTAIIGGNSDNSGIGAAWIYTRSGGGWTQQGGKLIGTGAVGASNQGFSVALSADGNTAVVGGIGDNTYAGAVWVFTRSNGVWTQQGPKLVGSGGAGPGYQGTAVALSADGNTAIVGAYSDNYQGAAWVFTRAGGVWTQQGGKLGSGTATDERFGFSVALSADGNTALVGAPYDASYAGAAFIFTRANGVWTRQPGKLTGSGGVGGGEQGWSVALSADGNTAVLGGPFDAGNAGAAWIFTRSGGAWTQQGQKLLGIGAANPAYQGVAAAMSGDGNTIMVGAYGDAGLHGATWAFAQPALAVSNASNIGAAGNAGGPFTPSSFSYTLAAPGSATNYTITGVPDWLTPSATSGTLGAGAQATVTFTVNSAANAKPVGSHQATIGITNTTNGIGSTTRLATLAVGKPVLVVSPPAAIAASGNFGGPFAPASYDYVLSALGAPISYAISGVPDWLTPSATSGSIAAGAEQTITFTVNANATGKSVGTYGPAAINIANMTSGVGSASVAATLTVGTPGPVNVVSAVLPSSRSVQVGGVATAFITLINTADTPGVNCGLSLGSSIPASFKFQATDPATNAVTGAVNAPANIPAGRAQSFVFAIAPNAAFAPTDIPIVAGCNNSGPAPSIVGLNTLLLSASATPVPDIVALAATAGGNGVVDIAGLNGAGVFAVATVNLGIGASITASADTGAASLPVAVTLCQTNPATGACSSVTGPTVTTSVLPNETPTFAIFLQGSGNVPFDPAHNRIFVRFKDAGGVTRGATSVAARTQ